MKHFSEEELIAYREGEASQRGAVAEHLESCGQCREAFERIETVLAALDTLEVPDPGDDYGLRVWQRIAPRLPEHPQRWWQIWLEPRRMGGVAAFAAVILVAFIAGRITKHVSPQPDVAVTVEKVRERILVVAVGEHLGRSEMMLVELSNAEPANAKQKQVSIAAEQHRAEDLLEENRLYRQTAMQEGDARLASVLDDLERVLLDVAHSPDQVTPAQLESIRQRIESQGILFKVRVVKKELGQRQRTQKPAPVPNASQFKERNKV